MAHVMTRADETPDAQQSRIVETLVCTSCDGFCPVAAKVEDGRVVKVQTRNHPLFKGVLCMKDSNQVCLCIASWHRN